MPKASSSRSRKKRTPSPIQTSDSEAEDDELELDKVSISYEPKHLVQWSVPNRLSRQFSTTSSIHKQLLVDAADNVANQAMPPIETLPPEILIHILRQLVDISDLYSTLLVCRKWCECSVELLWLKPHFARPETLYHLLPILDQKASTFAYASFIRRLNFSSVARELDDERFAALAACTRLERLTLNGCERLTDEALITVLSCTPNLVALDLTGVVDVTDKTISVLAATSPKLQGVNLEGCKKVTDEGILALARNCPYLRRIKLCELEEVTSASISELVAKCPLLIEIDLAQCSNITDLAARDVWKNSLQLRELRLGQCFHITDQGFPVPPRLAQLPNTNAPGPGIENNLAHVRYQTAPPLLISQPLIHLRQLDLMHLNITDDAVDGIIANAPKIRNLVLAKCVSLTDKAVKSICNLGKHLHCLHLGHAAAITDESVILLAKSCPRLRYVDLACCPLLTDESVRHLAALPKLRRIGLVRVVNLTDKAVNYLGIKHNTIERVHLSYCDKITVIAIHRLLQRSPRLTHLSLTGVPAFRKQELQSFCRQPPPYFNEVQRSQFCVYSGPGVNRLRRYLESIIHDPRVMEPLEGEQDDLAPSDADDPPAEPYPEQDMTADESPFAIPPVGYNGYNSANLPLPPLQQLHRTHASAGTSRSQRPDLRRYTLNPASYRGVLAPPSFHSETSGAYESQENWQRVDYEENPITPLIPHRGSVTMENHRMERNESSRGERRRRGGSISAATPSTSRTTAPDLGKATESVNSNSHQHQLGSSVDPKVAAAEAAHLATSTPRGPSPSWSRWTGFGGSASGSSSTIDVSTSAPKEGGSTSSARRTLQSLQQHFRPHQLMTPTSSLGPGSASGSSPSSRPPHTRGAEAARTPYAAAGSARMLPVAGPSLVQVNGGNTSDSSATSRERDLDGGDEEIDTHDRRSRNRDSDATVKGLRSASIRRDSVPDATRSPSPASPTTGRKKGIRGALSSAEQYASTFLFGGKGKARDQSPGGSGLRG